MSWPSPEFLEIAPDPFTPFVFIVTTERMPASIAMAAVAAAGMKYLPLPHGTTAADLPKIKSRVRRHYRESDGGNVPLFGRTTAYLFVYAPDRGILLDTGGEVVAERAGQFFPMSISIQDRI